MKNNTQHLFVVEKLVSKTVIYLLTHIVSKI